MPNADFLVTLAIRAHTTGTGRFYLLDVYGDGQPVLLNHLVPEAVAGELSALTETFRKPFDEMERPPGSGVATQWGHRLFDIWLQPAWGRLAPAPGAVRTLVIATADPEVLNLPWELTLPPSGIPLGVDPLYTIRRLPRWAAVLPAAAGALPNGPLRVLCLAAVPEGEEELDHAWEEHILSRAFASVRAPIRWEHAVFGTFAEFLELLANLRPHVVHLSGHGQVRDDAGYFSFEDQYGGKDERSAAELGQALAASGVQLAFISACQSGRAAGAGAAEMYGLCERLARWEVPMVLGWGASVKDDVAMTFSASFYAAAAAGVAVDRAVTQARHAVQELVSREARRGSEDLAWALPVLYAVTAQRHLIAAGGSHAASTAHRTPDREFTGRRRQFQRLHARLHDETHVVLLTGAPGSGRRTLAERLATAPGRQGLGIIRFPSHRRGAPAAWSELLEVFRVALLVAGRQDLYRQLAETGADAAAQLRHLIGILNANPFMILLDDADRSPEALQLAEGLTCGLTSSSRAVITLRAPLPGVLPPTAVAEAVCDLDEAAAWQVLLRGEPSERERDGTRMGLEGLMYRQMGGTPGLLVQLREQFARRPVGELRAELAAIARYDRTAGGQLQALRDQFCRETGVMLAYGLLSPEAGLALSQAAVVGQPLPAELLADIIGLTPERFAALAQEWERQGLASRRWPDGHWAIPGAARGWLAEQLSPDERTRIEQSMPE